MLLIEPFLSLPYKSFNLELVFAVMLSNCQFSKFIFKCEEIKYVSSSLFSVCEMTF